MDVASIVKFKQESGLQDIDGRLQDSSSQPVEIDSKGRFYSVTPSKNCCVSIGRTIENVFWAVINFFRSCFSVPTVQESRLLKLADFLYIGIKAYESEKTLSAGKKQEIRKILDVYHPIRTAALEVWIGLKGAKEKTPSMIQFVMSTSEKILYLLAS